MKQKIVWLMSGTPGSGKSTWVQQKIKEFGGMWCSRDAVRFSFVHSKEKYFDREDEVFNSWIAQICDALDNPIIENIYVDATHLTDKARNKVTNRLPKDNIKEIINVVFAVPVETCLERNGMRDGMAFVPPSVIRKMANQLEYPKKNKTIVIDKEGVEHNGEDFFDLRSSSGP